MKQVLSNTGNCIPEDFDPVAERNGLAVYYLSKNQKKITRIYNKVKAKLKAKKSGTNIGSRLTTKKSTGYGVTEAKKNARAPVPVVN